MTPTKKYDITDLLDEIFTALELGWDIERVRQNEKVQEGLADVSATLDELVEIARYVKSSYCVDCPLRYE